MWTRLSGCHAASSCSTTTRAAPLQDVSLGLAETRCAATTCALARCSSLCSLCLFFTYYRHRTGGYFYYATQTLSRFKIALPPAGLHPLSGAPGSVPPTIERSVGAQPPARCRGAVKSNQSAALLAPGCGSSSTPRGPSGRLLPRTGARPAASAVGLLRAVPSRSA